MVTKVLHLEHEDPERAKQASACPCQAESVASVALLV